MHRDKKRNRGSQGLGRERKKDLFFNGHEVSVWDNEEVLEMEGDDCIKMWIHLMPLNYTLRNGLMVNFVIFILLPPKSI